MTTGVLLLAAGRSRRFGADKRQATLADGRSLLMNTIDSIQQAGLPLLVCLGADDRDWQRQLQQQGIDCLLCQRADEGMGASLAEGIAQVSHWQAALVALGDMPAISPDSFRQVAAGVSADTICVPLYNGVRGHPVGFGRRYFEQLATLGGDRGARLLLQQLREHVTELPLADPGILVDVDSPEQLAILPAP